MGLVRLPGPSASPVPAPVRSSDPTRHRTVSVRVPIAVGAARSTARLAALVNHRGTALPGMVAERIWPGILPDVSRQLDRTVIVVGTNGKTTTTHLIARILDDGRDNLLVNRSGANMRQGVVSALARGVDFHGRIRGPRARRRYGLFEVDELALEHLLPDLGRTIIVATNLFRDQLDRYGEADAVVERWAVALRTAAAGSVLVSCGDDPRLAMLAARSGLPVVTFGLDGPPADRKAASRGLEASIDPVTCGTCGRLLDYGWRSVGHLGAFFCPARHLRRTAPDIAVALVASEGEPDSVVRGDHHWPTVRVVTSAGSVVSRPHLEGLTNAYNVAAAVAAASALGVDPAVAAQALDGATGSFGRLERLTLGDRSLVLVLVKNTVSLDETTRLGATLAADVTLIALNDAPADGRDVSWIWDASFARLASDRHVVLSGSRADDLVLRLKYDEALVLDPPRSVLMDQRLEAGLDLALAQTGAGGTVVAIATYTAMMALRAIAEHRGAAAPVPR